MDVSSPIRSVIPAVHGDVLAVLARTEVQLSGRRVAGLIDGVSRSGVQRALNALADAGIVLVEHQPPANLYRLNRRHLAADAIVELATIRQRMIAAMREHLSTWDQPPWGAWLFGSAARSDGSVESDIDVLVIRPDDVAGDGPGWTADVDRFADDVTAWTGNPCSVVEYSRSELTDLVTGGDRLVREVRTDGIALTNTRLPQRPAGDRVA